MKNRIRILNVLFFILLLALPLQVFADEKDDKHPHGDEKTEAGTSNDHGHDETDDHGHVETDGHEEMDQDEMDAHGHGETDGHEEMDQDEMDAHGHGETDGHEGMDQDEMDAHGDGHGGTDDHGDDGHGDGGHEYEEPGANWPLLGSFAAINGGFILFGAVRKINKKRKSGVN